MMSQMEQRARELQLKVQSSYEGQFQLNGTKWGTREELHEIAKGNSRIQNLGMVLLENSAGELVFVSSQTDLPEALKTAFTAKTLIIVGPERYLGIDSDGAGLKLFNLIGFDA